MARHLRPIERHPEEETQRRDRTVHDRRLGACGALVHLEPAQVLRRRRGRRAAEKLRKGLDGADVVALGGGAKLADRHVLGHALPQRADGRLAHRGAPVLRLEVRNPSILKTERPAPSSSALQLVTAPSTPRSHLRAALSRESGFVQWHILTAQSRMAATSVARSTFTLRALQNVSRCNSCWLGTERARTCDAFRRAPGREFRQRLP